MKSHRDESAKHENGGGGDEDEDDRPTDTHNPITGFIYLNVVVFASFGGSLN